MGGKPAEADLMRPSEDCILVLHTSRRSGFSSDIEGPVRVICGGAEAEALSEQNPFSSDCSKVVQILLKEFCFLM